MSTPGRVLRNLPFMAAALGAVLAVGLHFGLRSQVAHASDFSLFLGRFHPLVVHLPIGILLLVALIEVAGFYRPARARLDPSLGLVLPILVVSAISGLALGQLLARGGGYPSKLISLHRGLALAAVVGTCTCLAAWFNHQQRRSGATRTLYRVALGTTVGLLSVGAHFGGSMTRGESYLFQYAPSFIRRRMKVPDVDAMPAHSPAEGGEPLVFADAVRPILRTRCGQCHGPETSKAGLRLDELSFILKGGENGPALFAGNSVSSRMVQRLLLPISQDEHMPPESKTQLTPDEVSLIRWWIDRGASETMRLRDTLPPEGTRSLLQSNVVDLEGAPSTIPRTTASGDQPTQGTPAPSASLAPLASAPPSSGALPRGQLVWQDAVRPLLVSRCGRCHGGEKQKGKLRVDSLDALLAGGRSGAAITPTNRKSLLVARLELPLDADSHMPPPKEQQLSAQEIELIGWWIQKGASAELPVSALPPNLISPRAASPTASDVGKAPPLPSASSVPALPLANPSPSGSVEPPTLTADPTRLLLPAQINLFADVVKPLLESKCSACHSGAQPAGDLDIAARRSMLEKSHVVPGDALHSLVMERLLLPIEHDDHMPPQELPQPTLPELEVLRFWIASGASETALTDTRTIAPETATALALVVAPTRRANTSVLITPTPSAPPTPSSKRHAETQSRVSPRSGSCAACSVTAAKGEHRSRWSALAALIGVLILRRRGRRDRQSNR